MKINLVKINDGFMPADPVAKQLANKTQTGQWVVADVKRPRNQKFHRKYFALLGVGFDLWENDKKEFERFRKDVVIESGYYDLVFSIVENKVMKEAKSISFSGMDEDTFAGLYNKSIDVILSLVPKNLDRDYLMNVVEQKILGFV